LAGDIELLEHRNAVQHIRDQCKAGNLTFNLKTLEQAFKADYPDDWIKQLRGGVWMFFNDYRTNYQVHMHLTIMGLMCLDAKFFIELYEYSSGRSIYEFAF